MFKIFNRGISIFTGGSFSALKVNGTEVIDKDGKVVADITAPAGSIGTSEIASDAITNAKIADGAVSLEHFDSGIAPSHVAKFAGTATTAGGAAAEAITVTGLAATDIVFVTIRAVGSTPRTIVSAVPSTNTLTVTFSGDPSTDHQVDYIAFRAAA